MVGEEVRLDGGFDPQRVGVEAGDEEAEIRRRERRGRGFRRREKISDVDSVDENVHRERVHCNDCGEVCSG